MNFALPEAHQMKCSKFERAGRKRIGIRRARCVTRTTITGWKLAPGGCRPGRFGIRYENCRREWREGRCSSIRRRKLRVLQRSEVAALRSWRMDLFRQCEVLAEHSMQF